MKLRLLVFLVVGVMVSALACGSAPSRDDNLQGGESVGVAGDELSTGITRSIPLHFWVINGTTSCNAATHESISAAVKRANDVWKQAAVQFFATNVSFVQSNVFSNVETSATLPWASVYPEAVKFAPAIPSNLFAGQTMHEDYWLDRIAFHLTSIERAVHVMVPCSDNAGLNGGHASFPWWDNCCPSGCSCSAPYAGDYSNTLHLVPSGIGALAHELGHFLGLPHTYQLEGDPAGIAQYYDLIYGVSGSSIRRFTSTADANSWVSATPGASIPSSCGSAAAQSPPSYPGIYCVDYGNCDFSPGGEAQCQQRCLLENGVYYSTGSAQVAGEFFTYNDDESLGGANLMSYRVAGSCRESLAGSQVARVQKTLRETRGSRHLLGDANNLAQSQFGNQDWSKSMDFDGDSKRDVAVWRPTLKSCLIFQTTTQAQKAIALPTAPNPATGKNVIPVMEDFDRDGKTDCAVYDSATTAATGRWIFNKSAVNVEVAVSYGEVGDIPLAGMNFIVQSAPDLPELAVYRKKTSQVCWKLQSGAGSETCAHVGNTATTLLPGLYDSDALTDLGWWNPTTRRFYLRISSESYSTLHQYNSDGWSGQQWTALATDRPMTGVKRSNNNRVDFALWRGCGSPCGWPNDGWWLYLDLNPSNVNSFTTSKVQYGAAIDYPLPGFDYNGDGVSEEIVYRPPVGTGTVGGTFFVRGGPPGMIWYGQPGWVPFLSTDSDGDSKPEVWVFDPLHSEWYQRRSTTGQLWWKQWGVWEDIPL